MDLKVWWDEDSDDATIVRTPAELDEVLATAGAVGYAVLVELLDAADPTRVILDVGISGDCGVLYYAGEEHQFGCFSKDDGSDTSPVERELYYYMSSDREFPRSAILPLNIVVRAAHEYMESNGARPTMVDWQPSSVLA